MFAPQMGKQILQILSTVDANDTGIDLELGKNLKLIIEQRTMIINNKGEWQSPTEVK
jgi:hypothetical protein